MGISDSDGYRNRIKTVYSLLVEFTYNKVCLQLIVWFSSPSDSWLMIMYINMTSNNKQKVWGRWSCLVSGALPLLLILARVEAFASKIWIFLLCFVCLNSSVYVNPWKMSLCHGSSTTCVLICIPEYGLDLIWWVLPLLWCLFLATLYYLLAASCCVGILHLPWAPPFHRSINYMYDLRRFFVQFFPMWQRW